MKAGIPAVHNPALIDKSTTATLCELVKLRLTVLVLLTGMVGFYLGSPGPLDYRLMFQTLLGTALLACGAAALNQLWEKEYDAQMPRTADRPLPSGRLQPGTVLVLGGSASMAGMIWLAATVNLLTAFLGAITLGSYLFLYTPLKRVTWLNTLVGAVPGALPPVMGWAGARGEINPAAWGLFAILFFWQLPHFLAIAWIYRQEYARAGFVMLPVIDPTGVRTGRQAVTHTLGLLPAALVPALFGVTGIVYALAALVLSGWFVIAAVQFARSLSLARARRLFFASIIYLPLLLGFMVMDKVKVSF